MSPFRTWRGRLGRWTCSAAFGVALAGGAYSAVRAGLSPFRALPDDGLRVYVSSRCKWSVLLFHQIRDTPTLADRILVLPTEPTPDQDPARATFCKLSLRQLADHGSRWAKFVVGLLPAPTACEWLAQDAGAYHRAHFAGWPAWGMGDVALEKSEEAKTLARYDIVLNPQTGRLQTVSDPAPQESQTMLPSHAPDSMVEAAPTAALATGDGRTFSAEERELITNGIGRNVGF